jgi:amidohydrolase
MAGYLAPMFNAVLVSMLSAAPEVQATLEVVGPMYRQLHAAPELSGHEVKTAAVLTTSLQKLGFTITSKLGGVGFVAVLRNGAGPTVLLRTDLDALPVQEQTGLSYASKVPGVMHACGHDVHMASWLGAAMELKRRAAQWKGTLVLIAQPAEENGTGAAAMLKDGVLSKWGEGKPVAALALHSHAGLPAGTVGLISGPALANVDSIDVTFFGKGGHGAYPHLTVDPVVMAARFITAVQTLVAREQNPLEPAVVTVGSIHGGTKHNIVPDEVKLQLTARSYTPQTRAALREGIARLAKAEAEGARAPKLPLVSVEAGPAAVVNDAKLLERVTGSLRRELGESSLRSAERSMAGEDFGAFGTAGDFPSVLIWVGTVKPGGTGTGSLHSGTFAPDESATLETGVRALTAGAMELFGR